MCQSAEVGSPKSDGEGSEAFVCVLIRVCPFSSRNGMDLGFVMRSVSGNTLEREWGASLVSGLTMVSVHDGRFPRNAPRIGV